MRKITLPLSLLLLLLLLLVTWANLPALVAAVPSIYRIRLPERLQALAVTPLPTALPAPATGGTAVALHDIILPTATPSPTATLSPTPLPTLPPTYTPIFNAPATPLPTPTLIPTSVATAATPLPAAFTIEGVHVIPQKFNNCGPTTLSINLAYYGVDVPQLDIAAELKPNYDDRNVNPWELRDYVTSHTPLRAALYRGGDLDTLKRFIAHGFPVIIEEGYEPSVELQWMGHYLTLIGYDDDQQSFLTIDTYLGPWDSSGRPVAYTDLAEHWQAFNHTFLLVYAPSDETAVKALLNPAWGDETAMWQTAVAQAQAAIASNANNPFAWFNLGASLTELGQITGDDSYYQNAVLAFDQARQIGLPGRMLWYQFTPYIAYLHEGRYDDVFVLTEATMVTEGGQSVEEGYYYRAQAYAATGHPDLAAADYRHAIALNPHWLAPQEALSRGGS